jgi:hypothetical protein
MRCGVLQIITKYYWRIFLFLDVERIKAKKSKQPYRGVQIFGLPIADMVLTPHGLAFDGWQRLSPALVSNES